MYLSLCFKGLHFVSLRRRSVFCQSSYREMERVLPGTATGYGLEDGLLAWFRALGFVDSYLYSASS
jgi:hypothetical protein